MNLSTIIQPCNDSGPFDPAFGSKFGIADYDWSNMKNVWVNTKPMDCEKLLVEQAQMNRKLNPHSKAFVYRNLVKALNWFGSVREKLDDPAYSGFFLKFDPTLKGKYHVPPCDESYSPPKCSVFYHDQEQSPGHPKGDGNCVEKCDCGSNPCGEYLWCANTTWPRHTPRGQPAEALHAHTQFSDGSALRSASLTLAMAFAGTTGTALCFKSSSLRNTSAGRTAWTTARLTASSLTTAGPGKIVILSRFACCPSR